MSKANFSLIRSKLNPFGTIFSDTVDTIHVENKETGEWSTYQRKAGESFDYETYPWETHRQYTHFEYLSR